MAEKSEKRLTLEGNSGRLLEWREGAYFVSEKKGGAANADQKSTSIDMAKVLEIGIDRPRLGGQGHGREKSINVKGGRSQNRKGKRCMGGQARQNKAVRSEALCWEGYPAKRTRGQISLVLLGSRKARNMKR